VRQQDFFVYMRVMHGTDYITGMKIPLGNITWQQLELAVASGGVVETRVPGCGEGEGGRVVLAGGGAGGDDGGLGDCKAADKKAAKAWKGWENKPR